MVKTLFAIAISTCFTIISTHLSAQSTKEVVKKFNVVAGPQLGGAFSNFSITHNFSFGAFAQGEIGLVENWKGLASLGLSFVNGKSISGLSNAKYKTVLILPLLVGAKYDFENGFYLGANAGFSIFSGGTFGGGSFTLAPMAGYESKRFDLQLLPIFNKRNSINSNLAVLRLGLKIAK